MAALCHPAHIACAWSHPPPTYDPAAAKALLADAGLAGGFDLELLTWGQGKTIAEAVAGDLRKIGGGGARRQVLRDGQCVPGGARGDGARRRPW